MIGWRRKASSKFSALIGGHNSSKRSNLFWDWSRTLCWPPPAAGWHSWRSSRAGAQADAAWFSLACFSLLEKSGIVPRISWTKQENMIAWSGCILWNLYKCLMLEYTYICISKNCTSKYSIRSLADLVSLADLGSLADLVKSGWFSNSFV